MYISLHFPQGILPWGTLFEFIDVGNKNIIAFERNSDDESLVFIANYSPRAQDEFDLSVLLNGSEELLYSNDELNLEKLNPYSFYILKRN